MGTHPDADARDHAILRAGLHPHREDTTMTTEPITTEQLGAAPLGTTIIRGVNGPADRITEVVAVKAGTISPDDHEPWMIHGSLYEDLGRRWRSGGDLAARLPDDARLAYPADPIRDEPVAKMSGAAVNPLDGWLAANSTELAERISHSTVSALREVRDAIDSEVDSTQAEMQAGRARVDELTALTTRIVSLAAI